MVERKQVGTDRWVPVSSGSREPHCDVQGLQENGKYLFRVAAVNDCGQGDWIELPEPVIAKYPFGECACVISWSCSLLDSVFASD